MPELRRNPELRDDGLQGQGQASQYVGGTEVTPAQLRAACAMLQITAADLAKAVDMHPGTLREMLAGKRHGKQKTLEKIRAALGKEGIVFLDEDGVKLLVRPTGFEPATKPL